jgi:hypothetical protein
MNLSKTILLAAFSLLTLQGCHVPLQPYRLSHPAIEVPATPSPTTAAKPAVAFASPDKDCVKPDTPICLAFIEVDDMGELFDKAEVDTALSVIRRANDQAKSNPGNDPIVITFVHGWKNNASEKNGNVAGFKAALQAISSSIGKNHPIIGVYIGWRGDLIRSYLPVARQLSYYNREATAVRVPGSTLSTALTRIVARTHENSHAVAILIGHSFGGLMLERSISEATASQIAQESILAQEAKETTDAQESAKKLIAADIAADSHADLVIFINPAGAATEAKQMLDFLTYNGYRYQPETLKDAATDADADGKSNNDADRPLFVSLTSTADLATKVALPIGHGLPYLGFKNAGSFRDLSQEPNKKYSLACFDPHKEHPYFELKTKAEGAVSQGSYYLSSTPHMEVLQSHNMLKAVGSTQMRVASTGELIPIHNPKAIADCDRTLFNQENLNIVSTFRLADTGACFAVQERPKRCNGTPYWVMEIDPDVVPDHGTIFTQRFISFLIDTFFSTRGQALQRLNPQLMKTR